MSSPILWTASFLVLAILLTGSPRPRFIAAPASSARDSKQERFFAKIRLLRKQIAAQSDDDIEHRVLEAVDLTVAQIKAGVTPQAAWLLAAETVHLPGGVDQPDAPWRSCFAGQAVLATWRLVDRTGAPVADTLDSIAAGIRQHADIDGEVRAALAAPRATARLLAALPLVALVMGEGLGMHPINFLFGSKGGLLCGLIGVVLLMTGLGWMHYDVNRVAGK
ncbi:MAG: hypothetical protein ACRCTR_09830 [Actinomycetota bacterium]